MRDRTPKEIYNDLYQSALWGEQRRTKNICDNCAASSTCKYHNNPKNAAKVVKDCGKYKLSDEVLKIIEEEWRREINGRKS